MNNLCAQPGCETRPKIGEACHLHKAGYRIDVLNAENEGLRLRLAEAVLQHDILKMEAALRLEEGPKLSWDDLECMVEERIAEAVSSKESRFLVPHSPARKLPRPPQTH